MKSSHVHFRFDFVVEFCLYRHSIENFDDFWKVGERPTVGQGFEDFQFVDIGRIQWVLDAIENFVVNSTGEKLRESWNREFTLEIPYCRY